MHTNAREPWLAVFLTLIYPGLGHIYARKYLKGVTFIILSTILFLVFIAFGLNFIFNENAKINMQNVVILGVLCMAGILMEYYVLFNSYKCAKQFNISNNLNIDIERKKSPWLSAFLSCLFPSLGQFYNGQVDKGAVFFVLALVAGFVSKNYTLFLLGTVIKIIAIYDAFNSAEKLNGRENSILKQAKPIVVSAVIIWWIIWDLSGTASTYIKKNFIQAFKIPTGTMQPTLEVGDLILVNKIAYKDSEPRRGDVLVFKYPEDPKKEFVKRIVGLPGESIEIKGGEIHIDGNKIVLPEKIAKIYYYNRGDYGKEGQVVNIPSDSYFVLGDNSASSKDSRYFGFVKRDALIGRAFKIYYPFKRSGKIE